MRRGSGFSVSVLLMFTVGGCGSEDGQDGPVCLDQLDAQCTPAYDPSWDNVYEFTISASCAAAGVACHGREGMQGGLGLFSQDAAYAGLVGGEGESPRVKPGDPACSSLMERLSTTDEGRRMPLKSGPLSAAHLCSVQQWIAKGANP